jgi:hypothetical protein
MVVFSIRVVLALILVAVAPYTLTVAALLILWFDQNFYDIFCKNPATHHLVARL